VADARCILCKNFRISLGGMSSKCGQCKAGYQGEQEEGSSICVECPVDMYRDRDMSSCKQCATGTDGVSGSTKCRQCAPGNRATILPWNGFVWNFVNSSWTWWTGLPPNKCVVGGMGADIQICATGQGIESISHKNSDEGQTYYINEIVFEFACESCEGGLAYSSNFDYSNAFLDDV
jgi:hypothetical protein